MPRENGANLVVEGEGAEQGRVPLHMLDRVVSFDELASLLARPDDRLHRGGGRHLSPRSEWAFCPAGNAS